MIANWDTATTGTGTWASPLFAWIDTTFETFYMPFVSSVRRPKGGIWERTRFYIRLGRYRIHKFLILWVSNNVRDSLVAGKAVRVLRLLKCVRDWTGKNYRKGVC